MCVGVCVVGGCVCLCVFVCVCVGVCVLVCVCVCMIRKRWRRRGGRERRRGGGGGASVGRLLDRGLGFTPLLLVWDGDLISVIHGSDAVRVGKVNGHTVNDEVREGQARAEDQFGDDQAHAVDLGRRIRQSR